MGKIHKKIKTLPLLQDGERAEVPHYGERTAHFIHECCDCGLMHDVTVSKGKKNYVFRFFRKTPLGMK